jgi:hypothetical protein
MALAKAGKYTSTGRCSCHHSSDTPSCSESSCNCCPEVDCNLCADDSLCCGLATSCLNMSPLGEPACAGEAASFRLLACSRTVRYRGTHSPSHGYSHCTARKFVHASIQMPQVQNLRLHDLDDTALSLILQHLDVTSLCSLACTNKDLSIAVYSKPMQPLWRQKLKDLLPYTPMYLPAKAMKGHKWSDIVKHVVQSLKGPSDKACCLLASPALVLLNEVVS